MKRDLPPYVYRKKGKLYFERRGWQSVRLTSEEGSPEFWAEYALILRGTPAPPPGKSVRALIASYKRSRRFGKLAPRTKQDYDKVLAFIADRLGSKDPAKIKRHHVVAWRDQNSGRFADYLVQVLRVVFEHAIDIGWIASNPAKGVQAAERERKERLPWPDDLVQAFRATATGQALLAFEMLVGTGQRIGDVLAMQWAHIEGDGIWVRQGKTGKRLYVPFTARLRDALASAPRRGLLILTTDKGRPLSYHAAYRRIMAVRQKIGAQAYDIHALRYRAAHELAEAGCSDELIQAVTGHTTAAMVRRYSGQARQKVRAIEAQRRRTD